MGVIYRGVFGKPFHIWRSGARISIQGEDEVYKEMVLNLRVRDDSAPVIKLNPPYDLMVDLSKIVSGRGERTRTFDLTVPNRAR